MTYAEAQAAVLADTQALQHTDLIARKINAACNYISRSGKYYHDLVDVLLDEAAGVDSTVYVQAIPIPARFRAIGYLSNAACPGNKIKGYTIDDLASKPGATDVCYVAGNMLRIKHSVLTSEFALGYYTLPALLVADSDTNWLLDVASELVVDYAVAMVLVQLGEKEISQPITAFSQQNLAITMRDLIDTGGKMV